MKLKINFKKVISAFILIVVICSVCTGLSNSVYARTNEVYKTPGEVGSIDVDQAVADSPILSSIAHFIYAIAGFIETIVGSLVSIFTGQKIFPWADRVIFNTMPLLDINFLSPEPGSLFANLSGLPTALGNIVRNIYYTIFVLSVTFFGVVVGIMALKLAISSIAAEKAKYKQAITNWLLALILLFTVHYLMSFIFFINEKMVEVASSVVISQNLDFNIDVTNMTDEEILDVIKAVIKEALEGWSYDQWYTSSNALIVYSPDGPVAEKYNEGTSENNKYIQAKALIEKYSHLEKGQKRIDAMIRTYMNYYNGGGKTHEPDEYSVDYSELWKDAITEVKLDPNASGDNISIWTKVAEKYGNMDVDDLGYTDETITRQHLFAVLIADKGKVDHWGIRYFSNLDEWKKTSSKGEAHKKYLSKWYTCIMQLYADANITKDINVKAEDDTFAIFTDAAYILLLNEFYGLSDGKISENDFINGIRNLANHKDKYKIKGDEEEHFKKLWKHAQRVYMSRTGAYQEQVFTGMAEYFKGAVHSVYLTKNEDGETEVNNFSAIPAILYSIFVIQSIMYFIAYLKRFFYILVLALFAPLVVIYDFLTKTAMG